MKVREPIEVVPTNVAVLTASTQMTLGHHTAVGNHTAVGDKRSLPFVPDQLCRHLPFSLFRLVVSTAIAVHG